MRINEFNKGSLDFVKGVGGALLSKSKDKETAALGKRALARSAARHAGSPTGQKKKKAKMSSMMLDKWNAKANKIRIDTGSEPTTKDLNKWIKKFMGDRDLGEPYNDKISDKQVKSYFDNLVNRFYTQQKKRAKQKVSQKKTDSKKTTTFNPDAILALKQLGHSDEEIQVMLKNASRNNADPNNVKDIIAKAYKKSTTERTLQLQYLTMLTEDARIQHAEDIIFWEGSAGAQRVMDALHGMANEQHKNVTLKWDGSPAIVFGRDDRGQFIFTDKGGFVKKGGVGRTTSSEALKNELLMRSGGKFKDDPDRIEFADRMAGLFNIYEKAVPANHKGFFKGDLLYATTPPVENNHYTFKPNIVTYSVGTETALGKRIGESISGVVIHRELDAEGNESEFKNVDIFAGNDVFVVPSITTVAPVKPDTKLLKRAEDVIKKNAVGLDAMLHEPSLRERQLTDLPKIFYSYINSKVDTGLENLGSDFLQWLETTKLSGKKKENVAVYINEHKAHFKALWIVVTTIKKAKNGIIEQFDAQGIDVKQSIGDQSGGEGYVLAHPEGDIKLVPRASFSAANRAIRR